MSPPCLAVPFSLQPGLPPPPAKALASAPPPPPPAAAPPPQGSLEELRAAGSVESSTKDVRLLGDEMADTVQDNAAALALLTQAVDRLLGVRDECPEGLPGPLLTCSRWRGGSRRLSPSLWRSSISSVVWWTISPRSLRLISGSITLSPCLQTNHTTCMCDNFILSCP